MMDLSEKLRQFNEQQEQLEVAGSDSRVLFVDGTNSYIRCFSAMPSMNDDGEHVGGIIGFLKSIGLAIRQYRPSRVVCVFDGAGGSQRRRSVYGNYKSNRKPSERLNRTYDFNSPEQEVESMKWQLLVLIEILENLPVTIFHVDNIEADDTIGYLSSLVIERGGKSIIMSTDKDFLQLVNENCTVLSPTKKKMYTIDEILAEYKIHPTNFLLLRTIEGDKSDNIPGVLGVGPSLLVKNYPEFADPAKITIQDLLDRAVNEKGKAKNKTCQKILDSKDLLLRNQDLMRLDEINVAGSTKLKILDKYDSPIAKLNKVDLTKLFGQYKLYGSFSNYNDWLLTTWIPLTRYQVEGK